MRLSLCPEKNGRVKDETHEADPFWDNHSVKVKPAQLLKQRDPNKKKVNAFSSCLIIYNMLWYHRDKYQTAILRFPKSSCFWTRPIQNPNEIQTSYFHTKLNVRINI